MKLFNLKLPSTLKLYLKKASSESHKSMGQYIIDLIIKDINTSEYRLAKQLEKNEPVKNIEVLSNPRYSSDRLIEVGDFVMYGFLELDSSGENIELINFHIDEYGQIYRLSAFDDIDSPLPRLVKV